MNENSQGFEPEQSTKRNNEGLPKREDYEYEDQWEEAMWQYFVNKVVITKEELEAYTDFRVDELPDTASVTFEINGKNYEVVVFRFPADRPPHEWSTRIFVVKDK
jgi:hypothetical protein